MRITIRKSPPLLPESEYDGKGNLYMIEVKIVINTKAYTQGRNKNSILTDVRAVDGITIVKVLSKHAPNTGAYDSAYCQIKYLDTTGNKQSKVLARILSDIRRISGVVGARLTKDPVEVEV
jgi:hypothetical protein